MAVIGVLQPRATRGSSIVDDLGSTVFFFHATIGESHEDDADITFHPVEEGSDVTDHVQLKPFRLTLTGIVTATPLDPESLALDAAGLVEGNRVGDAYQALKDIHASRSVVTVVTGLRSYDNMLLKSITVPRGTPRQSIRPSLVFVQLRFADSLTVPIPAEILAATVRNKGQSKGNVGKQATTPSTAQETAKGKDALGQLKDVLGKESVAVALFGG